MSVVHLAQFRRARHVAQKRGEYIRDLVDELRNAKPSPTYIAGYYEAMGWADADALLEALKLIEEGG